MKRSKQACSRTCPVLAGIGRLRSQTGSNVTDAWPHTVHLGDGGGYGHGEGRERCNDDPGSSDSHVGVMRDDEVVRVCVCQLFVVP